MTISFNFTKKYLVNLIAWFGYLFITITIGFCIYNTIYWIATGDNILLFGNPRLGLAMGVGGSVSAIFLLLKLK